MTHEIMLINQVLFVSVSAIVCQQLPVPGVEPYDGAAWTKLYACINPCRHA